MLNRARQAGGPIQGKALKYRRGTHESGNTIISFMFTDPKVGENNG